MLGDHLRTKMQLFGVSQDPDTMKCLLTAGEKGVDIDTRVIGLDGDSSADSQEFRNISALGTTPCLRDVDFVICGTLAVMSYLDDKGFGPSLVPRNGVVRAVHYQWIVLANQHMAPAINELLSGGDAEQPLAAVSVALDALADQLRTKRHRGDFIVGDFSMADIHWAPYVHACNLLGHGNLITSRPEVNQWWDAVKVHKSTSKENFVAYEVLPSMDDIRSNRLSDVQINV